VRKPITAQIVKPEQHRPQGSFRGQQARDDRLPQGISPQDGRRLIGRGPARWGRRTPIAPRVLRRACGVDGCRCLAPRDRGHCTAEANQR